ncbi:MAG: ATP synthase F1 subunit epsilon [Deltaproteobacteria bacterium]|jgi:F-type H+-transporting ATPase subunit epsilon|nr:ATP synthase F1 subunit epsilon [Deltaproteobacteria bacterium]
MSDRTFKLTVVSPDKALVLNLPVIAVGAMGSEGAFTALPGHLPFLTELKADQMWYRLPDQSVQEILVSGGFVEVLPERVTILANSAERPNEIDPERAERARLRSLSKLKSLKEKIAEGEISYTEGEIEIKKAEIKLIRSMARLKAVRTRHK